MICSRCKEKEASVYQKIHGESFEKEISLCGACFSEMLKFETSPISKKRLDFFSKKASLIEERNFKDYSFIEDRSFPVVLPLLLGQEIFVSDMYKILRLKKSAIISQISFYEKKITKALFEERYEEAHGFQAITEELKKLLEKKQ